MSKWTFVCAFNRDRDSYQIPLAIAESGHDLRLVTDYYHGAGRFNFPRLKHRQNPGIKPQTVSHSRPAFTAQIVAELLARVIPSIGFPDRVVDSSIGRTAARAAREIDDPELVIYSNYAAESFEVPTQRSKTLFQYHPCESIINAAMSTDDLKHGFSWEPELEQSSSFRRNRYWTEVQNADRFLVASQFTARGLVGDGVEPSKIRIVPYGCPEVIKDQDSADRQRQIVFLGQGIRRKGLHLLLRAWSEIRNHDGFQLLILSSRIDPVIRQMIDNFSRDVTVVENPSHDAVKTILAGADTLALPSLVEGFGLVLGEALAAGCRLLASTNTGIEDLALSPTIATVCQAGSLEDLRASLQCIMTSFDPSPEVGERIREAAAARDWASFRVRVRDALDLHPWTEV